MPAITQLPHCRTLLGTRRHFRCQLPSPTCSAHESLGPMGKKQELDSPPPQKGIPEPVFCANYFASAETCLSGITRCGRQKILGLEWLAWRGTSPLRFDQYIHRIRAAIPKVQADAAVGKLYNGGRDSAGSQIP